MARGRRRRPGIGTFASIVFLAVLVLRALAEPDRDAPGPPLGPGPSRDLAERSDLRDLGLARYPATTPSERATLHLWESFHLPHRVGYALDAREYRETEADFQVLAEELGFARARSGFTYVPTDACPDALVCAWRFLMSRNESDIRSLADRFARHVRAQGLSRRKAARLVITFVQTIPYEKSEDWLFGLIPPNAVAWERRGDCDSKALLAILLLRELGIDAVMLSSEAHGHAVVGVDLPYGRHRVSFEGRPYAMTEVTAYGWPLGEIPPSIREPDDWVATRVAARLR